MLAISDRFDDPKGTLVNWNTNVLNTAAHLEAPVSGEGLPVPKQQHVDLRSFYQQDLKRPIRQDELDQLQQFILEELPYDIQYNLEWKIRTSGENWKLEGSGFAPADAPEDEFRVGLLTDFDGWRGLEAYATGTAINADIYSSIPVNPVIPDSSGIDITGMDWLSMVFAGDLKRDDFTAAASYIELSSYTSGTFTQGSVARQYFSDHDAGGVEDPPNGGISELRLPISGFTGTGFDPTKVRGVRIHFEGAATAGERLVLMAIRALKSTWRYKTMDVETRYGIMQVPVTIDGTAPETADTAPPMLRGENPYDNGFDDPKFVDGNLTAFFTPGGWATGYVQSGTEPAVPFDTLRTGDWNTLDIHFREYQDDSPDPEYSATAGWSIARLQWNQTNTRFQIIKERAIEGDEDPLQSFKEPVTPLVLKNPNGSNLVLDAPVDADAVNPLNQNWNWGRYAFQVSFTGTNVEVRLFRATSGNRTIGTPIWSYSSSNIQFEAKRGRMGLWTNFPDRNAHVDELVAGQMGYATIRSMPFESFTPVDGAQLTASFSSDANLFRHVFWHHPSDQHIDNTKSISGAGSYRTRLGLTTNQFMLDDWESTYIDLQIWVGNNTTIATQPKLVLTGYKPGGGTLITNISLRELLTSRWNHIAIDLSPYRNPYTGIYYTLSIVPPEGVTDEVWIDNIKIGRRQVSWQFRAHPNMPWRDFGNMVNKANGAIHLPPDERGTAPQLQGMALTPDAWVAGYRLKPRYAQLGLPVYDESFEKR